MVHVNSRINIPSKYTHNYAQYGARRIYYSFFLICVCLCVREVMGCFLFCCSFAKLKIALNTHPLKDLEWLVIGAF